MSFRRTFSTMFSHYYFVNTCFLAISMVSVFSTIHAHESSDHEPIGEDIMNVPLFDAHIHYKEPAWEPFPPKTVIELMDENGVAMGLVSSTPDKGTIDLWQFAPNRIVPELRPYYGDYGSSNWTHDPDMKEYLLSRLEDYPHQGIGEFHVHNIDTSDKGLLREVTQMAKQRNIPIHIHSGVEPVRFLYELEPDLTIIWAHAGMSEPPQVIDEMFTAFPSLYADTSYREREILESSTELNVQWKELIMKFSDRLMVGSDTWVNNQWENYNILISMNRLWLSMLPREVAEKIAYKNAEKLFNVSVSNDQIGIR